MFIKEWVEQPDVVMAKLKQQLGMSCNGLIYDRSDFAARPRGHDKVGRKLAGWAVETPINFKVAIPCQTHRQSKPRPECQDHDADMADRIGVISKGELIVVEDKSVLMHKLGKKQLCLTLRQPLTSIPAELGERALALSEDGHTLVYTFDSQKEETGIAELLRLLSERGIEFKDLRSSESSLEDIFVSLIHQSKGVSA